MSPQPGVLPVVAPSGSPPQSLVTTSYSATKTTDTAKMTTTAKIAVESEKPDICCVVADYNGKSEITTTTNESSAPSSSALPLVSLRTVSSESNLRTSALSDDVVSSSSGSAENGSQKGEVRNSSQKNDSGLETIDSSSIKKIKKDEDDETALERPRRILLKNINPHIICNLCKGYLIDATTIVECLHSFCHSCIMKHLRTEQYCPRCEMMINTAKPNIKPDTTLQAIVYKLVPGLYEKELMRKRAFYRDRPEEAALATPEQRGEDTEHLIFGPTEKLSLSLEYADLKQISEEDTSGLRTPKYLQCPAIFTVAHLKKFIALKFGIEPHRFIIEIMYKVKTIVLMDHYTLMDVAYIYTWKRDAPMRFFFRVKENEKYERRANKSLPEGLPVGTRKIEEKGVEKLEISCSGRDLEKHVSKENEGRKTVGNKTKVEGDLPVGDKSENSGVINAKNEGKENVIENSKSNEIAKNTKNSSQDNLANPKQENSKLLLDTSLFHIQKENAEVRLEPPTINLGQSSVEIKTAVVLQPSTVESPQQRLSPSVEDSRKSKTPELRIATPESSPKLKEPVPQDKCAANSALQPRAEKLKITLVGKNKHAKSESPKSDSSSSSLSSTKSSKSGKAPRYHHHHASQQKTNPEHEERKVENIKLKIDLSKQSSVTIINVSGPESNRKEIVKSVKSDKEWKLKLKRDKEDKAGSPKNSPGCDSRHQRFEIKTSPPTEVSKGIVPPITLKAERIIPTPKKCTPSPSPLISSPAVNKEEKEKNEEEKKSEFLNSFALTPIKAVISPEKNVKTKSALCHSNINIHSAPTSTTTALVPTTVSTTSVATPTHVTTAVASSIPPPPTFAIPVPEPSKQTQAAKRKIRETSKTAAKKSKTDSPKLQNPLDLKKKIPATNAEGAQSISFKLAPFPIGGAVNDVEKKQEDEKLMPAPPPLKMLDVFKKNGVKATKPAKLSKNPNKTKTANVPRAAPPGSLTPHPMAPPASITSKIPITASAPGSRTPIARRYPPILPKPPRPNPFANIPSDMNKLLQSTGTEIKQISSGGRDVKVYGPSGVGSPAGPKAPITQPSMQTQSPPVGGIRPGMKNQNANNYLNYALFNASKARMPDVPLGCRTPIYTPSSPIYSPNSPQYMPNYNIPTQPTYKYTKTASNAATNYLQNVLGLLSNLFPAPPIKKPPESPPTLTSNNKSPPPENEIRKSTPPVNIPVEKTAPKRSHSFTRSPTGSGDKAQEPPEKQMKVQTLLNSCNINIPSSLSITITNEDGDASVNNSSNPKHKSPVNNYIEILKLPDNQPISPEKSNDQKKSSPPSQQLQQKFDDAKLQSSSGPKVLSPPPPALYTLNNNSKQVNVSAANVSKASQHQPLITVKSFANLSSGKANTTTTSTASSKMKVKKC